jgi:hypothetical protein
MKTIAFLFSRKMRDAARTQCLFYKKEMCANPLVERFRLRFEDYSLNIVLIQPLNVDPTEFFGKRIFYIVC